MSLGFRARRRTSRARGGRPTLRDSPRASGERQLSELTVGGSAGAVAAVGQPGAQQVLLRLAAGGARQLLDDAPRAGLLVARQPLVGVGDDLLLVDRRAGAGLDH